MKVRGTTQVKDSSHGLRTGGADPLQPLEPRSSMSAVQRVVAVTFTSQSTGHVLILKTKFHEAVNDPGKAVRFMSAFTRR
jgi:hypothetical protein